MTTKLISINDSFEVFGYRFKGLDEVRAAVEIRSNIPFSSNPYITTDTSRILIPGIHVLELYERYPCFDSFDYDCENRYYQNWFFSRQPFTRQKVEKIAKMEYHGNATLMPEQIEAIGLPHLYYVGDYGEMKLTL